jgi:hypothetical protein
MKDIKQISQTASPPQLGDPMTQMYYEIVQTLGSYAGKHPHDFEEARMWKLLKEIDSVFLHHMRELIEEASSENLQEAGHNYHPAAQFIMDRLIRENQS